MTEKDVYQVADWKSRGGDRWVTYQAQLDAMMAVFGKAEIEAPRPSRENACWTSVAARGHLAGTWPIASARAAMSSALTYPSR